MDSATINPAWMSRSDRLTLSEGTPSIGIVVPVFNGAEYIAEALRSITSQNYPRLEVLVMDGGSTDGTVDIVRSLNVPLISEKDDGQADAIDRGLRRLDCDLVGWLNADDRLLP